MSTFKELSTELQNGAVISRESWTEDQFVFLVKGELLAPSFYNHYGVGFDKLPIKDVLCYSDDESVALGWLPTEGDELDDWIVIESVE
jgi:hypothetical protein